MNIWDDVRIYLFKKRWLERFAKVEFIRQLFPCKIVYTRYFTPTQPECEIWQQCGESHRIDGPATTWYNEDGTIDRQFWCIRGTQYTFEEWIRQSPLPIEEKIEMKLKR